jgi:hypothetical protein
VAKALFARAEELFVTAPQIQMVDIVAEKLKAQPLMQMMPQFHGDRVLLSILSI